MALVTMRAGGDAALSTAQTGTGDSTNTAVRDFIGGPAAIVVVTTVGATPTVTVSIQGSVDGVAFYNIPYALVGAPSTFVVTNPSPITTATTNTFLLQRDQAWKFVKLVYSSNTNVTITATVSS